MLTGGAQVGRVLMTTDAVGGVWTYSLDLARALNASGFTTELVVLGPPADAGQRADAAAAGVTLRQSLLPLDWTATSAAEIEAAGHALAALVAAQDPDIVHLNSPALAATARFARPVVALCHSCVATWWSAVRGGPMPHDLAWRADLVRRGYAASDVLVAPSASFATATAATYGLRAPPIVVPNGRAAPRSAPAGDMARRVFTAGRLWDEGKDVATLDVAAATIDAPVVAAGPTEGPNGARVAFRHLRTLGTQSAAQVARALATRPIFVSLARYEPFGLAVLEAGQAGCALVLSDIPTFRELWDGAAVFVPAGDAAAVSDVTNQLLRAPTRRAELGAAARARAEQFTVARMADSMLAVYRRLLPSAQGVAA